MGKNFTCGCRSTGGNTGSQDEWGSPLAIPSGPQGESTRLGKIAEWYDFRKVSSERESGGATNGCTAATRRKGLAIISGALPGRGGGKNRAAGCTTIGLGRVKVGRGESKRRQDSLRADRQTSAGALKGSEVKFSESFLLK